MGFPKAEEEIGDIVSHRVQFLKAAERSELQNAGA